MEEITLEDVRPSNNRVIHTTEDGDPVRWADSIEEPNRDHDWGIIRMRVVDDGNSIEILEFLEPSFKDVADDNVEEQTFDTWEDAEEFISSKYEQPETPNEIICPRSIDIIRMEIIEIVFEGEEGKVLYKGEIPDEYLD